ncbi:MAG: hypothetical protein HND52_19500 [Ignavibacteriae bacterium]|nr:hypothetical protein [Ignavibacteriota bacterium]NOH00153.1 hypothetical protein [Ignavibacteriota bacterium]
MEKLDFRPAKSKKEFRKNYELHDLAEYHGKNLLTQWGIKFNEFGKDKRYEAVWEKGKDKPDLVLLINNKKVFLDWKGKKGSKWLANKRAVEAYEMWKEKFNIPVVIVFFVFDNDKNISDRRIALLGNHPYNLSTGKQWDKNKTVEFINALPHFSKQNLLNLTSE